MGLDRMQRVGLGTGLLIGLVPTTFLTGASFLSYRNPFSLVIFLACLTAICFTINFMAVPPRDG